MGDRLGSQAAWPVLRVPTRIDNRDTGLWRVTPELGFHRSAADWSTWGVACDAGSRDKSRYCTFHEASSPQTQPQIKPNAPSEGHSISSRQSACIRGRIEPALTSHSVSLLVLVVLLGITVLGVRHSYHRYRVARVGIVTAGAGAAVNSRRPMHYRDTASTARE